MRKIALATCLVGCLARSASASPLTYSEALSGDLTSYPLPIVLFTLDLGANTVSGTQFRTRQGSDFDSFGVLVPAGMVLTQITYAFAATTGDMTVFSATSGYWLKDQPIFPPDVVAPMAEQLVELLGPSPMTMFPAAVPLPGGPYYFLNYRIGVTGSPVGSRAWSSQYTWTLEVEAVPEPSTVLLCGIGAMVAAFGLAIRRR